MIIDTRTQAEAWLEFWQHAPPRGVLLAVLDAAAALFQDADEDLVNGCGDEETMGGHLQAMQVLREAWERLYG